MEAFTQKLHHSVLDYVRGLCIGVLLLPLLICKGAFLPPTYKKQEKICHASAFWEKFNRIFCLGHVKHTEMKLAKFSLWLYPLEDDLFAEVEVSNCNGDRFFAGGILYHIADVIVVCIGIGVDGIQQLAVSGDVRCPNLHAFDQLSCRQ